MRPHIISYDVAATHRVMCALGDYALVPEEVMAPAGSGPGRPDGYRAGCPGTPPPAEGDYKSMSASRWTSGSPPAAVNAVSARTSPWRSGGGVGSGQHRDHVVPG